MQAEDNARIAHLEQQLDELKRENAQLKTDLHGLRTALRQAFQETNGVLEAVERQAEAGKMRLERMLARPVNNTRLIEELIRSWPSKTTTTPSSSD